MGITWDKKAIERIIGALLAAHPGFTPNYSAIAAYFGQSATYDSIQGRFRAYHKVAEEMRRDNPEPAGSRTPVRRTTGNGRVSKPSSTPKGRRTLAPLTPTKSGKTKLENGVLEAILIDEGSDCFIKRDNGGSAPFAEGPTYDTSSSRGKFESELTKKDNANTGYDVNRDFLAGLENASANLVRELGDVAQYSSELAGYAEYDDTV
ncbi:hypothetical protein EMPG_10291 [Blastomyces silverae]|uniref:Uncharacterized protein n=1 Tax=Blastomyces silverae TaxID=2060906 RepID=A0A0H1B5S3_9EURO|nr:hypothetical protein EMPG_10291 [Blastomyces silverae]